MLGIFRGIGNVEEGLRLLDIAGCVCPGDLLTYECIVLGEQAGTTVWTGTVFNCTANNREISLFHDRYESTEGAYGVCGDIVGRSINTTNGNISTEYYVSRLTVPISSDTAGKVIDCQYDNGVTVISVEKMTISAPTGHT